MVTIKLTGLISIVLLTGCQMGGFIPSPDNNAIIGVGRMISEQNKISNLPPAERCERIRVDLREECRQNVKKEVDELTEAMKNKDKY